jgi:hypothetical protein
LKAAMDKCKVTHKAKLIGITTDFSTHTSKTRAWMRHYCKPILFYPENVLFIIEGEVKTFFDKQKVKEFMTTKPAL